MAPFRSAAAVLTLLAASAAAAQTPAAAHPDLAHQPTLYVIPYAHLDTQWRWEFPQSISEYLLKTMRVNFYYFDKYPNYVFNWTGSNRYRLMKEYFPSDYAKMKQYIAQDRWFVAGSSVEENDVNLPSSESIFRQVLYGNEYYRHEFGKTSYDYMLPDCFGFPASLPTILAHAGVRGFSTQKLNANWQPGARVGGPDSPEHTPEGIPFNVGLWKGPDGETLLAALNPGTYGSRIRYDLSKTPPANAGSIMGGAPNRKPDIVDWPARIQVDGKATGVFADYHYVGTGDIGGGTDEETVKFLDAMVGKKKMSLPAPGDQPIATNPAEPAGLLDSKSAPVTVGDGPVRILATGAGQMFRDITPEMTSRMPTYQGDLELINHSAGSLTSQAWHKRWNRENELLADAAETTAVAAAWMGGPAYPQKRLTDAWTLVLGGQFHDTGAGTATPRSYEFAHNDDILALNQFAQVLSTGVQTIASTLDTTSAGVPLVLYNPLNIDREDVVEVKLPGEAAGRHFTVVDPDGKPVPTQTEAGKTLFVAKVPATGFAVYSARPSAAAAHESELKVTKSTLENARYRIRLNDAGDIASIFDKKLNHELLAAPMQLAISTDAPQQYPAWNMDWDQAQAAPRTIVAGPATVRIVENGPVRVALEVTRQAEGSKFAQTVRLSAGDAGNRVEFSDAIDWHSVNGNLKAVFPLAAHNPNATYNWEVGTIDRPTAKENQFEVASHHWIDLTDASGSFGTTLLTGVKNGSDKRDDHTLRLTLLRTPGFPPNATAEANAKRSYSDQLNQDWGHQVALYGLSGHTGAWRDGGTDWQAYRLSQPIFAFTTAKHAGTLGRRFSIVKVSSPDVRILALKKAEESDDVVVRMVELHGQGADNVDVRFPTPIASAQEVNGQELEPRPATVTDGALRVSFKPYQPRTFTLHLGAAPARVTDLASQPVTLQYDLAAASADDTPVKGGIDGHGNAMPAEMLPASLAFEGVNFNLAHGDASTPDAVTAHGQTLQLPAGDFNRVYVLAASANGDHTDTFRVGQRSIPVRVENWTGFLGQPDTRLWKPRPATSAPDQRGNTQPLRHDWAVSANHAEFDLSTVGTPWWSPRYPDDYLGLAPGFLKRAPVAWYASHQHTADGRNQPYAYSYLFGYALDLPAHATTLTLPQDPSLRILAVSVAHTAPAVVPAAPLYDELPEEPAKPAAK